MDGELMQFLGQIKGKTIASCDGSENTINLTFSDGSKVWIAAVGYDD